MKQESPSLILWLLRKTLPYLVFGALAGVLIGFLRARHPDGLRVLRIIASALFGCVFLLYTKWSLQPVRHGYNWSRPERAGIFSSALGALILCVRLAVSSLPGPLWAYFAVSIVLAFIVRPVFNDYGFRKYHGEQSPPAYPERRADAPSGSAEA